MLLLKSKSYSGEPNPSNLITFTSESSDVKLSQSVADKKDFKYTDTQWSKTNIIKCLVSSHYPLKRKYTYNIL